MIVYIQLVIVWLNKISSFNSHYFNPFLMRRGKTYLKRENRNWIQSTVSQVKSWPIAMIQQHQFCPPIYKMALSTVLNLPFLPHKNSFLRTYSSEKMLIQEILCGIRPRHDTLEETPKTPNFDSIGSPGSPESPGVRESWESRSPGVQESRSPGVHNHEL